ncbi:MAG: hypothetical protein RIS44_2100 [Pseudomonadota bacterium]|jgi:UPF0176 protein
MTPLTASAPPTPLCHIAFFRLVDVAQPEDLAAWLRKLTIELTGSILVASEGINGVLAGTQEALNTFQEALAQDPRFAGMPYKRSQCSTPPFARMKVHTKPEVVAVGLPAEAASLPLGGVTLSPQAWREFITQDDVVLLDNRNSFEFKLGHFQGAIDPGVTHFRDFPAYVQAHADQWKQQGKRVAMYCTGGIRCEKLGGWMQHGLGLDVYQLDGGVLNYFQALPDADKDWKGECFVFDNRIALDTQLNETATTAEQVYGDLEADPHNAWRLQRAKRLDEAG